MKKVLILVVLLLSLASVSEAQQVTWVQNNVASATQAQNFTYKLYVTPAGSTTSSAPINLSSVLCGGTLPNVQCSTVLPQTANAALVTGAKTELTATDGTSAESPKSPPFSQPAAAPTTLKITPAGS